MTNLRTENRRQLASLYYCECCMYRKQLPYFQDFYRKGFPAYPSWDHFHDLNRGTDMHEIVGRGNAPRKIQDALWAVGNALWLCSGCHQNYRWAVHKIGLEAWSLDLLFIVRSPDQIRNFVTQFEETYQSTSPIVNLIKDRLG